MSRTVIIAALLSVLLHVAIGFGGYLFPAKPVAVVVEAVPTIQIELPPPPEPEEPEVVENLVSDAPAEAVDFAPPMQNDVPSPTIDSPFVQQLQNVPVPAFTRPTSDSFQLPTAPPRPGVAGGLKNVFNLADLDKNPVPVVQPPPPYPFELKRAGVSGKVTVRFMVDSRGNVLDPEILQSTHTGFNETVLNTVVKWRFRPGQKGGAAVNTRNVQVTIPFTLQSE